MTDSKRILLIQAYQGCEDPFGAVFPIGLSYLATVLSSAGHQVQIFDANTHEDPYQALENRLTQQLPEVVGLGIRNIDSLDRRNIRYHYKTVDPTLHLVKQIVPKALIMAGGSGFSMFAEKIMQRNPIIDIGVFFEAEEIITELMENLESPENVAGIYFRKKGDLIFTGSRPMPDINSLPIPRRDFLNLSDYPSPINNVGIQTKRGCLLNCAYCSYPFLNGRRIRLRDPEKVVQEIAYLANQCGVREFMFVDGVFNNPQSHAVEICELIIRKKLDVKWSAWCDMKTLSEKFLDLAVKAGMRRMPLSPDATTDRVLKKLGKNLKTRDIDRTLKLIRKYKDLHTSFGFFAIAPGQTFFGLLHTLFYYFKINLQLYRHSGGASIAWIRIEPHTKINAIALKEGVIQKETDLLPEKESDLIDLFYSIPKLKATESTILFLMNNLRDIGRPIMRMLKRR